MGVGVDVCVLVGVGVGGLITSKSQSSIIVPLNPPVPFIVNIVNGELAFTSKIPLPTPLFTLKQLPFVTSCAAVITFPTMLAQQY